MYTIEIVAYILISIRIGDRADWRPCPSPLESPLSNAPRKTSSSSMKTADYISEHLGELTHLARSEKLTMLTYLLEMAQLEAMEVSESIRLGK